ncbi:MAG: hypothetical protein HYV63_06250 [Candidatus Schekmanbacteria bacterium]|nr:hypothetical protein [Candidatus Schekmanbacteria bacterium]
MASWARSAVEWLWRVGRGTGRQELVAAGASGPSVTASGAEIAVAVAAHVCDGIFLDCHEQRPQEAVWSVDPRHVPGNLFGRPPGAHVYGDSGAALGAAAGLAMTGGRSAAFLSGERVAALAAEFHELATRGIPFVAYVADTWALDRSALFTIASGFRLAPRNAQQVADLSAIAHRAAELALVPGVVAVDAAQMNGAREGLEIPLSDVLRRYLGAPDSDMVPATPAQRLLFGDTRRRVPAWIDLDRPIATGMSWQSKDLAAVLAGRRIFVDDYVREALHQANDEYAQLTGRSVAPLSAYRLDVAAPVAVVPGTLAERLEGAAQQLFAAHAVAFGVLGIQWCEPFPARQVAMALQHARSVAVVGDANLLQAVRGALRGRPVALVEIPAHAAAAPSTEELARVLNEIAGGRTAERLFPAISSPGVATSFPKRKVLLEDLAAGYARLTDDAPKGPVVEVAPAPGADAGTVVAGTADAGTADAGTVDAGTAAGETSADRKTVTPLPMALRRLGRPGRQYDNVAAFWGEVVEPAQTGDPTMAVPEPRLALGVSPPSTSTFWPRGGSEATTLPILDPQKCSGCGACWRDCPDAAWAAAMLPVEAVLVSAMDRCGPLGEAEGKLRRMLKQVAGRAESELAKTAARVAEPELFRDAFAWTAQKMGQSEAERNLLAESFERVVAGLGALPAIATERFFHTPRREKTGGAELLLLALNPQACQSCGVCIDECTDGALASEPRSAARETTAWTGWIAWEQVPDTSGAAIEAATSSEKVGKMAGILLSRHCQLALPSGDGAEAGSGARLALRHVIAVTEYRLQQRRRFQSAELLESSAQLRKKLRELMIQALPAEDIAALDSVLDGASGRRTSLSGILGRLDDAGKMAQVDTRNLRLLVSLIQELEAGHAAIASGPSGLGRARYAVAVLGPLGAWRFVFPYNPFQVPAHFAATPAAAAEALGIAEGLLQGDAAHVRLVQRAAAAADRLGPDSLARDGELKALPWRELGGELLSNATPLLAVAHVDSTTGAELANLLSLLASELPIKLVLLDGGLSAAGSAAALDLRAAALRHAHVIASSPGAPDHLFEGVSSALAFPGPALIHLHAPSPARHGFPTAELLGRARLATSCRVHPLFEYDPRKPGAFGSRCTLAGNAAPDRDFATDNQNRTVTPLDWVLQAESLRSELRTAAAPAGERRMPAEEWLRLPWFARTEKMPAVTLPDGQTAELSPDLARWCAECLDAWRALQELSGAVATPWLASLREAARAEAEAEFRAELEREKAAWEQKLATLEAEQQAAITRQIRDRLMLMAGKVPSPSGAPTGGGDASG